MCLLLPGGVLSVGGGFFFGLWWGFLIVLLGNVIGAAISFFISRLIGERWLHHRLIRNPTLKALEPAVEREGWKIILLSQLHPLFPSSLMNYLYGLTRIRFRTCMLWVAIGQAPGLFLYAYLGTLGQLGLNLARGKTHPRSIEYLIWFGGLGLSAATLFLLGRIALRLRKKRSGKTSAKILSMRKSPGAPIAGVCDLWRPLIPSCLAMQKWFVMKHMHHIQIFLVGAALLTQNGDKFTGCNVENLSYGLTMCAGTCGLGPRSPRKKSLTCWLS